MTNPGFQAQQAAQQAQQAATQANLRFSADSSANARRAAEMGRPRPQYYVYLMLKHLYGEGNTMPA